jgi:hypothetical protein
VVEYRFSAVVAALLARALHGVLVGATGVGVEPIGVVRVRDPGEREAEAGVGPALAAGEGVVQHLDLAGDLRVGERALVPSVTTWK